MELKFFSIEEVKEFVKQLKGTRGGKAGGDDDEKPQTGLVAPQPLAPPAGGTAGAGFPGAGGFAPPAGGAAAGGAFPAAGAPALAPEVQALVTRINTRIDGAIASGQPADQVLTWFRGQCGQEAANATMDQIKANFLPKLSVAGLENIAKLMNA